MQVGERNFGGSWYNVFCFKFGTNYSSVRCILISYVIRMPILYFNLLINATNLILAQPSFEQLCYCKSKGGICEIS